LNHHPRTQQKEASHTTKTQTKTNPKQQTQQTTQTTEVEVLRNKSQLQTKKYATKAKD
jgi:DNA-binding transcriptional regulator YiaG